MRKIILGKQNIVIFLIVALLLITILVQNNLEVRIVLKYFTNQELTLEEISNSEIYAKYKEIQLNGNYVEIEKMFRRPGVEDSLGLGMMWKFDYGSVRIGLLNEKIIYKQIVFYNAPKYAIEREETKNIKGITTFESVEKQLGKSLEYGQSMDLNNGKVDTIYTWRTLENKVLRINFCDGTVSDIGWH